jgi:hypothetical protein
MNRTLLRKLILAVCVLAANAVVIGLWWIGTEPQAYLWTPRASPEVTAAVRQAGLTVFWARWPLWALPLNAAIGATLLLRAGRRGWAAAVFACAVLGYAGVKRWEDPRLADEYFTLFQLQSRPEPLITEPIEEAGPAIGPYLVSYIQDPDAGLIRYAIAGIGRIGYAPAVPELTRIMNDPARMYYVRADAWEALSDIGTREAKEAARRFRSAPATRADTALANHMDRLRQPAGT